MKAYRSVRRIILIIPIKAESLFENKCLYEFSTSRIHAHYLLLHHFHFIFSRFFVGLYSISHRNRKRLSPFIALNRLL